MQTNDSRLIKAAKRTIRAEATLVVVIIIITSWSVYALYKLATGGSESILGFNVSKVFGVGGQEKAIERNSSKFDQQDANIYSQPNEITAQSYRNQLLREILNKRRELFGLKHEGLNTNHPVLTRLYKSRPPEDQIDSSRIADEQSAPLNSLLEFQRRHQQFTEQTNIRPNNQINKSGTLKLVSNLPSLMQINPNLSLGRSFANISRSEEEEDSLPLPDLDANQLKQEEEAGDKETAESTSQGKSIKSEEAPVEDDDSGDKKPDTENNEPSQALDDQGSVAEEGDSSSNSSDLQNNSEDESSDTSGDNPSDEPEDDSLKATGHAIDEEVDRMTQPSSSDVVSQQDQPVDYKNTVQFDDSPSNSKRDMNLKRQVAPGNLIARFVSPQSSSQTKKKQSENDLQVDHNEVSVSSGMRDKVPTMQTGMRKSPQHEMILEPDDNPVSEKSKLLEPINNETKLRSMTRARDLTRRNNNQPKTNLVRQKRSSLKTSKIGAPYEIDHFLDNLEFENLIGLSTSPVSVQQNSTKANNINISPPIKNLKLNKELKSSNKSTDNRRSDGEDEEEDDGTEESSADDDSGDNQESEKVDHSNNTTAQPNYKYLASNDRDLQNLLAEKRLLDALSQSRLPSPTLSDSTNAKQMDYTVQSNNQTNNNRTNSPSSDHQTAGSLYSVDHGLLLYPSADEESFHKSKSESNKKKEHEKMKKKKKMTEAMKKGGHKKKKHKKMEKKYLKEKKFKGAKKGKKMSKGKGGQGGKKGKKLFKDKGFKKKGFKNVYHKEEFGQKKSYFDEYRDKDFKKKWKKFDDKYNYAQMKKWQAKDVKGAKKMKDHGEKFNKYDKSKWKKKYLKHFKEHSAKASMKKKKKHDGF